MPDTTITYAQARELARLDDDVAAAKQKVETAERARDKLRTQLHDLVPVVDDDRGVRELHFTEGGKVRVTPCTSGRTFALAKYENAGGKITKAMEPHVGDGSPYDRWTTSGVPPAPRRAKAKKPASSSRRRRSASIA